MLFQMLRHHLLHKSNGTFFRIKRGLRHTVWTGQRILDDVERYRQTLHDLGLQHNDTVILWAQNMPEWSICFLACIASGIVVVPADPRTSWQTVLRYAKKVRPKCIIASQLLAPLVEKSSYKKAILEEISITAPAKKRLPYTPNPLIEIVFTSGSSGDPKGVMISEKNILAQLEQTPHVLPPLSHFETLSLLPLSHIYEQMYGLFMPIVMEGTINYLPRINPLTIRKALKRYQATYLIAVPQLLRILFDGIERTAKEQGKEHQFQRALAYAKYLPVLVRRVLFRKVHQSFGGSLQFLASGSAPLEPKLAQYWEALGFTIVEGYGATETTGMATVQRWDLHSYGNVGEHTRHANVKIDNTGEICIQGDIVSPGYFHDKQKTDDVFIHGWYRTGDAGRFTGKNELVITGRHSSRIIMTDGTKVYPEDIERELNNFPEVKDSCVIGQERNHRIELHAYVLPKRQKDVSVDQIRLKLNQRLEDRQQLDGVHVWNIDDFPRLRTLKIDRQAVSSTIQSNTVQKSEPQKNDRIDTSSLTTILQTCTGKQKIDPTDQIGTDLHLDSLGRIQLASLLEERFGIEIQDLTLTPHTTVDGLLRLINTQPAQTTHRVEDIVNHWRFFPIIRAFRIVLQRFFIFPFFRYWAHLSITQGEAILRHMPPQSIIIFNHIGMFDVLAVASCLPFSLHQKIVIPVTNERWDDGNRIVSFLIDLCIGGYPFAREGARLRPSMEATGELVDRGYSLIFAPEGTMQRERKMQKFKPGLGYLVKELRLPVIMVKLSDEYRDIWPAPPPGVYATSSAYYYPQKKGKVGVRIGMAKIDATQTIDEITTHIEKQFVAL